MHNPARKQGRRHTKIMLDDHGFEIFEQNRYPLAYLLTFRTYGTWLHGDRRGSHCRYRDPRTGSKFVEPNRSMLSDMRARLDQAAVHFTDQHRKVVKEAVAEVTKFRGYKLNASNVLPTHAHVVLGAAADPDKVVNELKSYSTRRLRENGLAVAGEKVWTRGASTRYLWKPLHVGAAVDYVLYCQEDIPFEFRD